MKRVFMIRHAETTMNVSGRVMGPVDAPITEEGINLTYQISEFLSSLIKSDYLLITSPAERCLMTYNLLIKGSLIPPSKPIIIDSRLKGVDSGHFNGLPITEIAKEMNLDIQNISKDISWAFCGNGGEQWDEFSNRCLSFYNDLKNITNDYILFITHGFPGRAFLSFQKNGVLELKNMSQESVSRSAIYEFLINNDEVKLFEHKILDSNGVL